MDGPEAKPSRVDDLAFAGVFALAALDLRRWAFVDFFIDEDTHIATGWLMSRGLVLYRDIFTHHMPVDYIPAWLIGCLFDNRFAAYRGFMAGLWGTVCLALFLVWRRAGRGPAWAAILFAALTSQWIYFWGGQMMLVESYWGYALILLLAFLGKPVGVDLGPPGLARSLAAGFLLAFIGLASPTCVLPAGCLAAWLAFDSQWRRAWRRVLTGGALWSAALGAWCLGRVDLGLLFECVIRFNAEVYARFHGIESASPVEGFLAHAAIDNLRYFSTAFRWGDPPGYFEGVLKIAVLAWALRHAWLGQRGRAVWWVVFVVCVKARSEFFADAFPIHGAAFYLMAALLVARQVVGLWLAAGEHGPASLRIAVGSACALALAATTAATSPSFRGIREHPQGDPDQAAVIDAIRRGSDPADRIAVFPNASRIYLETSRLPAVPNVFYLPWQAAWPPQRSATLEALKSRRPKLVAVKYGRIWGIPWNEYAPEIEAWLRSQYDPAALGPTATPQTAVLYVAKTYREEFERRLRAAGEI